MQVVATCATDAVSIIESLGSDYIIDYKSPDATSRLKELGEYINTDFNHFLHLYTCILNFTVLGLISSSIALVAEMILI